ncbi:methylated-DNA--[protein]-cysteine S-methyltransferase [Legionella londiniensis]|uniref:Methylated DNA protein cysteine S-methyltransferase n=1 Tax=Legionella londiniensis TaxID=45068 RepID=A0A0W0VT94_9GAMM|nr:methylated-DNA--[protein]-cysteine S-methyltransferase [Legionella londiniensis]KTD23340.1 methylated DNA protein cysteine S- methyltransferase [Legionella londiniensis]STX94105.1 Methylated DNA-protein cysteine methyltransferase [Legionella londiniensis]
MLPIVSTFKTPFGLLEVAFDEQHLLRSAFKGATREENTSHPAQLNVPVSADNQSISQAARNFHQLIFDELAAYFQNPKHRIQIPLKPHGSAYQLSIWNALLVIPSGRTMTYGELAIRMQTSPRAVGQACKNNPLPLFIPCHRVVGKTSYGGYMGNKDALCYKLALLNHEGKP